MSFTNLQDTTDALVFSIQFAEVARQFADLSCGRFLETTPDLNDVRNLTGDVVSIQEGRKGSSPSGHLVARMMSPHFSEALKETGIGDSPDFLKRVYQTLESNGIKRVLSTEEIGYATTLYQKLANYCLAECRRGQGQI